MKRLALVFAAAMLATPLARAADPRVEATAAYNEGMDLRSSGKVADALPKLQRANALYPTAITGLELGRTLMLLGRLRDAREALATVARIGPRANESARANNARAEAAALAVEIGSRIPKLRFRHEGTPPTVTVDGAAVADVDVPIELDPGTHAVDITRGAAQEHRSVVLAEGKVEIVDLGGQAKTTVVIAPPPPPVVATSSSHTLFWVGVAATGASLVLGGVSGAIALVNANDASPQCVQNQCSPAVASQVDAAKTWSTVSTIGFAAAGAFAIFSLVAWFAAPRHASTRVGSLAIVF